MTGVKDYKIFNLGGVKVAVIGITNPEAPTLVFPGNFGTIEVSVPIEAANRAREAAAAQNAKVFVAITHLCVTGEDAEGDPIGPLIDFANGADGFDVIFGDHTNVESSTVINGALVVENRSRGRTYARVDLTVDPKSGVCTTARSNSSMRSAVLSPQIQPSWPISTRCGRNWTCCSAP